MVSRGESFQQNNPNKPVPHLVIFLQTFHVVHVKLISIPVFLAVSGNPGTKILIVVDVLSSHEPEIYRSTSIDGYCIEVEFLTDRNFYVDLREFHLALKLKIVRRCGYETYKSKEFKKEHKEEAKADEPMEE